MDELEWAIFFGQVVWFVSLSAPLAAGVAAGIVSRRPDTNRVRVGFIGSLVATTLGAAGSYVHGDGIIGALMGSGDIPYHLIAAAWHRMWYPLGIGLVVAFALALVTLLPGKGDA